MFKKKEIVIQGKLKKQTQNFQLHAHRKKIQTKLFCFYKYSLLIFYIRKKYYNWVKRKKHSFFLTILSFAPIHFIWSRNNMKLLKHLYIFINYPKS